jgi:arylsulfatase A-like enzyme
MSKKPNLLFICSDQQRTDTIGAYGNDWIDDLPPIALPLIVSDLRPVEA